MANSNPPPAKPPSTPPALTPSGGRIPIARMGSRTGVIRMVPAVAQIPEEKVSVHEILRVVHTHHWHAIRALAAAAIIALGYMTFGRIPVAVEGTAMLLTPGTVVPFQATASGQILRWHVRVGDVVKKGQLLCELEQPLIKKQLEQSRQKLADLETKNQTLAAQTDVFVELEREAIDRKKKTIQSRIDVLRDQINTSRRASQAVAARKKAFQTQHEKDLEALKKLNEERERQMAEKVDLATKLAGQGLRSEDEVLGVKRQQMAQEDRTSGVDLQKVQASLDKARSAESLLETENRITEQEQQMADLENQLQELESQEAQLSEQTQSAVFGREMEASEARRAIGRFEEQLTEEREVRAEYAGRVIELTTGEGELVSKGINLGSIDTRDEAATLAAVAYFKLSDGNKIKPGMTIRIIPAIVDEKRFGGLVATVKSVSNYPVTEEGVARTIGNSEAARTLTKDAHYIEVYADLRPDDTFSGYEWERFGGPDAKITAGTMGTARANTLEVRPLAFVIPILKEL
ncbi:MAG: NHLP bacteriocin system secretion protein [Deltaproteobacteria bacterium]|nr:NHLP bacteriocin system secretion protein [Deltaproteobacteria bacterium]